MYKPSEKVTISSKSQRGVNFLETGDKVHFFYEDQIPPEMEQKIQENSDNLDTIYSPYNKVGHAQHDIEEFFQKFTYNSTFAKLLKLLGY